MTRDIAPEKAWTVRLTCCGKDDGVRYFDTWAEADGFRNDYTSGYAVDPNGYSGNGYSGHQRSAVVVEGIPRPTPTPTTAHEDGLDAINDRIDARLGDISEGIEGLIEQRDFWQDEAQRLSNALTEIAALNAYSMGSAMGIASAALRGDRS